ncbi:hypothetical protein GCM10007868_11350 [Gluconobacter frateurii]|nr:hypothetical protein GCM10007868_11350 [Gluconobacter frateurii]
MCAPLGTKVSDGGFQHWGGALDRLGVYFAILNRPKDTEERYDVRLATNVEI